MKNLTIMLASQSVARKALLESLGYRVEIVPTYTDESHNFTDYSVATQQLALRKLTSFFSLSDRRDSIVVAADTLVSIDSHVLGKPKSREDAYNQLNYLQGKSHIVTSGFALYLPYSSNQGKIYSGYDEVTVTFHPLDEKAISAYLDTSEYIGAAGSYRIQEEGKTLVSSIYGDITTVVGLPILKISAILERPENFVSQEYPPKGEK
jgi:septum formation protein